ncbi:murein biosynthesis integral membrane protein MurJ [Limibaculum sp. FT325]|uniref:murein biosynthesis integral membrane protein MurJ n=1 Tax=Thermohalobaculum sediminis TaxID=2939436 RepID=UPI0020BE0E94|nr:murein biosynthesis integral membrane protein MurJ [Limibaculum sediminis]MCL5776614.1 murein biosynthesis integral membrane protein MurJ [Limibaculum sediminis]
MSVPQVRLFRAFATVGGWTMASRVLGFVRDILMAAFLGSGPVAQAFVVAFTLPNLFRRFFAEGAFNTAFVPMFAKRLEGEGPEPARRFAEEAMAGLAAVLIVFTLLAQAAMPWLVLALASGFAGDQRFDLAVLYARIAFPYILFISLAALISGVLNSLGRFAAAAAAQVALNVVLIAALAIAESGALAGLVTTGDVTGAGSEGLHHGALLTWGVGVAGVAQLWLVWHAAARAGMRLELRRPRLTPALRRLAAIALPAALAGGVMQINIVVGRQVASHFEGAIAWLWYADRVFQLPLGVVGVAVGVVLLPELSRRVRAGDMAAARDAMNRAAEFCLILTVPAAVAFVAIPGLISAVLFERGAFTAEDTAATALGLAIYALGLPAFVLQKVLQPAFFAREDTRTPLRFALWSMLANVAIAAGGAPLIGWTAAAIGSTVAAWVNLALLWRGARRLDGGIDVDPRLAARAPRILAASLLTGLAALGMAEWLSIHAPGMRAAGLGVIIAVSAAFYFTAATRLGAFRLADLRASMRRG